MLFRAYLIVSALMLAIFAYADYRGYTPFGGDDTKTSTRGAGGGRVYHK